MCGQCLEHLPLAEPGIFKLMRCAKYHEDKAASLEKRLAKGGFSAGIQIDVLRERVAQHRQWQRTINFFGREVLEMGKQRRANTTDKEQDATCTGCEHIENHRGPGHCYMFKDKQPRCALNNKTRGATSGKVHMSKEIL